MNKKKLYSIVLEAQTRGVAFIKEGVTGAEVDAVCRNYIKEQGYGSNFWSWYRSWCWFRYS